MSNKYAKFALIKLAIGADRPTRQAIRKVRKNPDMLEAFTVAAIDGQSFVQGPFQDFLEFILEHKEELLELIMIIIDLFSGLDTEDVG